MIKNKKFIVLKKDLNADLLDKKFNIKIDGKTIIIWINPFDAEKEQKWNTFLCYGYVKEIIMPLLSKNSNEELNIVINLINLCRKTGYLYKKVSFIASRTAMPAEDVYLKIKDIVTDCKLNNKKTHINNVVDIFSNFFLLPKDVVYNRLIDLLAIKKEE